MRWGTIEADHDSAGHAICQDHYATLSEWERRGKWRNSQNAVWVGRILTYMAGAEAEAEFLGRASPHDWGDQREISYMLEHLQPSPRDLDQYEARLRRMAHMLVRRHRELIKRVVAALVERRTLSAEELDQLVGRSVADVEGQRARASRNTRRP